VTRVVAASLLAVALVAPAPASADDRVGWNDLRAPVAAERNPFERLTARQVDWISEIARGRMMQVRGRTVTGESAARHDMLAAALAAQGLDAEELLRQRDALIEQRRAAAETAVPAVAGREARLHGHRVPASADGTTVTDFLFVPWANACSHTPAPANQIARIPASDIPGAHYSPSEPPVLSGRVDIQVQVSRLRFVDGVVELRSLYVIHRPSLEPLPTAASTTTLAAPAQLGSGASGAARSH